MRSLLTPRTLFGVLLVCYLCLAVHFYLPNMGGCGLDMPYNQMGWVFVTAMITCGIWQVARDGELVVSRFHLWSWVIWLFLLIPLIYPLSQSFQQVSGRFVAISAGLLFYLSLLQFRFTARERVRGLYLVLFAVSIEIVIGLIQYFWLTPGNWIQYDTALNRPYGIFQQPNVMASFVATGLAISLYLCTKQSTTSLKGWQIALHGWIALSGSFILVVLQSRTGELAAIVVMLLLLPAGIRYQKKRLFSFLLLVGVGIFLGLVALAYIQGVKRGGDGFDSNPGLRVEQYRESIHLIEEHPLLGVGYGNFSQAFIQDYPKQPHPTQAMLDNMGRQEHPHNEILYWTVEGGIIALIALIIFGWRYLLLLRGGDWYRRLGLMAIIMPLMLHSQLEFPFYQSLVHWLLFVGIIYLTDVERNQTWSVAVVSRNLLRVSSSLILVLVTIYMLGTMQAGYWLERLGKTPGALQHIVYPGYWKGRVDGLRLIQKAWQRDDMVLLDQYQAELTQANRKQPTATGYAGLILLASKLGNADLAQLLRKEAQEQFGAEKMSQELQKKQKYLTIAMQP
ncbi:PglL family O-oligosaccharyltransferase [Dongshaea marina]|uniref:PglL family O-oligosaccharyltransferase n=1 Tax=Dongshaea marina TaxID=2047966 RepID=UPI000D3E8611|nr:Wzy polymerase domain-containing protein [Dongshaea marina]